MTRARYRFGVDIGGTFTDLVVLDEEAGQMLVGKTLTTPQDPSEGVINGLQRMLGQHGFSASEIAHCVHATTLITNALIERKGSLTGLITTRGFRDVLEIRRELRYDLYDLFLELPPPLVRRRLRKEVTERTTKDGAVRTPLAENEVRVAAAELADAGVEAIAIVFLHSYVNSEHEERAEQIVREAHPNLYVSRSSRVAREIREFERSSTTVANAYVQPLATRYLGRLDEKLRDLQFGGPLYLMVSSGGITTAAAARELPIRLTESGPAAGALVGGFYGDLTGERNVIAFDMGGTTAKACLIDDGQPLTTYMFEAGRVHRFKKGSGLPLKVPAIELIEIGAGGGSIARVDQLGLLKVGPDSAGAEPGPVCYGRGGEEPTVTDADLVLGYLNPEYFLGGEMRLDLEGARAALGRLGAKIGSDALQVAWGIHEIVNENMASAARVHIAERGRDPRKYALVATGGAGPVHAFRVAKKLGLRRILAPLGSGVASTVGLLVAPPRVDFVHAYVARLGEIDWERLNRIYEEMRREAVGLLGNMGVAEADVALRPSADLRYVGQGFEVVTTLPAGSYSADSAAAFLSAFETTYRELYERTMPGLDVEALNWRLFASGPATDADQVSRGLRRRESQPGSGDTAAAPQKGTRPVYQSESNGYVDTPVYDRYLLQPGQRYPGPAIVEERESTVVVGGGSTFGVDPYYTMVIDLD